MVRNIATVFTLSLIAVPVLAQGVFSMAPPPLTTSSIFNSTIGAASSNMEKLDRERYEEERNFRQSPIRQSTPFPPPAKLTYTPSNSRRNANLAQLKSNYLKQNKSPDAQAMLNQLFSLEIYSAVDAKFRENGLSSANIGDVYAVHVATNWQTAKGLKDSEFPNSYTIALAKQFRTMLAKESGMNTLNDAQKQFTADEMIAQILVASSMNEASSQSYEMKQAAQSYGSAALKQFGFDHTQFDITSQGYTQKGKKRSDASDAVPGGGDGTQLASASAAKGDTDEGTGSGLLPGVLIAGLAGSTLAAAFVYGKNKGAKKGNG
jgi:hypothetical protein